MNKNIVLIMGGALIALLCCSCSPVRPEGLPKCTPCTLHFELSDGTAVADAAVRFVPTAPEAKWGALGTTNVSGQVVMKVDSLYNGVPAGHYKVLVLQNKAIYTGQYDSDGMEIVFLEPILADRYNRFDETPLEIEIGDSPVKKTFTVEAKK